MGSVHAGFEPDFALSPDGSRLYVASGERERGELAVIDTSDGKIRNIAFPERILYHPWYFGLPPFHGIAVSADGGALGIPERRVVSPEKVGFQARIFLTGSSRFLRETIGLDNCEHARLVPSWTADEIVFLCPAASTLRSFRLGAESGVATGAVVPIPHENGCDLVGGFFQPDGRTLALVRTDGAIYQLDMGTQRVRPTTVTGTCQESRVFPMVWPRSPDGSKFYLGYGGLAPNGMSSASELRSFDTATWQPLGIFRTSVPFWSAVTSGDGRVIYALAPEQHSVLVLDAATGRQMRTISVGQTPALALVVP